MLIDNIKRIVKEQFPKENDTLIDKLGFILNDFMIQVQTAINGNLGIENFKQELLTINIKVNPNGVPIIGDKLKTKLNRISGIICVRVINQTNTAIYPSNTPLVSFSQNSNLITLQHITGLLPDNDYTLTLLLIT
jgi:hypothetical protein